MCREEVGVTKAGLCWNGPGPAAAAASGTITEQAQTPPRTVIRVGRAGVVANAEAWDGRFLFGGIDEDIDWNEGRWCVGAEGVDRLYYYYGTYPSTS